MQNDPIDEFEEEEVELEQPIKLLTNEPSELKFVTLELIYDSIETRQLGYMDGKDAVTGEIVPLLVGFDPAHDGGYRIFPIAKLLMKEKIPNYLVPDGSGNYHDISDGRPVDIAAKTQGGETEGFDEKQTIN